MKKTAIFVLAVILAFGLCACKMGGNEPTNPAPATNSPATVPSEPAAPTESDPIMDPTMDTNVPDPSVDNDHLIEPTDNSTAMPSPMA